MKIPIKRLIDRCLKIADSTADRHGFVAIRNLSSACNCQVVARPLLVEAAITTNHQSPDTWVVLIDSETHQFSDDDFEYESSISPLRERTRNTLAHEIAHAVACDLLGKDFSESGNLSKRLSFIERAIEKSSPLLLLPKSFIIQRLRQIPSADKSLQYFSKIHDYFGVSREVFLHAINTISKYNRSDVLLCESMLGALWGIVEFRSKRTFTTSSRLTFDNHFKATSHPASKLIRELKSETWEIESIREIEDKVFCRATPVNHSSVCRNVEFELELPPKSGRHKMFFRLPGFSFGECTKLRHYSEGVADQVSSINH
jgi:hypothetical protein